MKRRGFLKLAAAIPAIAFPAVLINPEKSEAKDIKQAGNWLEIDEVVRANQIDRDREYFTPRQLMAMCNRRVPVLFNFHEHKTIGFGHLVYNSQNCTCGAKIILRDGVNVSGLYPAISFCAESYNKMPNNSWCFGGKMELVNISLNKGENADKGIKPIC